MKMQTTKTERGFRIGKFDDVDGKPCSLQESSLATEAAIWFGVQDATPTYNGEAVPYPEGTQFYDRMHLTCHLASMIVRRFEKFLNTGVFPVIKGKPDRYGNKFSMFLSDDKQTIWLGCDDAKPHCMAVDLFKHYLDNAAEMLIKLQLSPYSTGWRDLPYPEGTQFNVRMHLNKELIKDLLPSLKQFIQTGSLR
jgi:hypothetical protein